MSNAVAGFPLPTKTVDEFSSPNIHSAYVVCFNFEQDATDYRDRVHARILGYLILHLPNSRAIAEVVRVIHSCAGDKKILSNLGECFFDQFIRVFRKFKGRTPAPSSHPSRPSFDKTREVLMAQIQEAPKNRNEAKTQALRRDGFRCVITGKYDMVVERDESLVDPDIRELAGAAVFTELAHILPESTYLNLSGKKVFWASSALAILERFGLDVSMVNGPKVHSLHNVMTMEKNVHEYFDRLYLWLEPTDVDNCYNVKTTFNPRDLPSQVTFTSPDPSLLPYPSKELLGLHAACAKVAHLSGAGERLDEFDRDADDLDVLAPDGSSFDVLTHALLRSTSSPVQIGA